jgi:penicillin-binding protein 1A
LDDKDNNTNKSDFSQTRIFGANEFGLGPADKAAAQVRTANAATEDVAVLDPAELAHRFDALEEEFRHAHGAPVGQQTAPQTPRQAQAPAPKAPAEEIPLTLSAIFADDGIDERSAQRRARRENASSSKNTGRAQRRSEENNMTKTSKNNRGNKGKRKKKGQSLAGRIIKWVVSIIVILVIAVGIAGTVYVYGVIKDTPRYDLADIEASLHVLSTMYDDQGQPMKNIYLPEGQRTLVTYGQLPQDLVDALVAIEDKTFWTHKGFNAIRIVGAIVESLKTDSSISGTSTITQQLARNIWLFDEKTERTLTRKIKEAFYARELEKNLSKEEILTAYLNTIALGNHSYGIDAAAKSYYNKRVEDLDLIESAALSALPKAPSEYAMIVTVTSGEVAPDDPRILLTGSQYTYLYNDTIEPRLKLVLSEMLLQGYITQAEHDAAASDNIRAHLHPQELEADSNADFFVSYAIDNIADDLLKNLTYLTSRDEAMQLIYSGGLDIYTTFNQRAQDIATEEYADAENFPKAQLSDIDKLGNIVDDDKEIVLFNHDYMFEAREEGGEPWFHLKGGEEGADYAWQDDGSMLIFAGTKQRLGIYRTDGAGGPDINLELKDFYTKPEGVLYMTKGGIISIPVQYKGMDGGGNLILASEFFASEDNIFTTDENGEIWIDPSHYTLRQEIMQPQSAFVLLDHTNGQLKAMVGGRGIKGQFQYNRALSPRQPGSTIKPIGVYGPAIEMSANGEPVGGDIPTYGPYWSPLSIIFDEQMTYQGRTWPKNWYSGYRGPLTLRNSIENSINVNAVKVQLAIGDQRSIAFLKKLGVTTLVEEGARNDLAPGALALGGMTKGLTPLELASAYGTFANSGVRMTPITYTLVQNKRGDTLLDGTPEQTQAMNPGTAFIMNDMLRTTVSNGIATAAAVKGTQVAGKTGTTSDYYDAWFVGNTPKYSAAVWIGCDVSVRLSQGSAASSKLFSKIMTRIIEGEDQGEYPGPPDNVVQATVSTVSSNPNNQKTFTDYFIAGTVPEKIDLGVEELDICAETGYLATPWCPNHEIREFSTLNTTDENGLAQASQAPTYYCHLHNLDPGQYPPNPAENFNYDFGKSNLPDLRGMAIDTAIAELGKIKLSIGEQFVDPNYSQTPAGVVVSQNPDPGTLLPEGSLVNVTISRGPDPATQVQVPNVIGLSDAAANALLAGAGLIMNPQTGAGTVTSQSPGVGAQVPRGSTVTVTF